MLTYFALLGLPEWTTLSRVQRRFVWQHCIHLLVYRWQTNLVKTCIALPAIFVAQRLGALEHTGTTMVAFFVVIFLLPDLFDTLMVMSYRRRVSSFIQSHETEIQSSG